MSSSGADVTIGCLVVPRKDATGFGVMAVDESDAITAFVENRRPAHSRQPRFRSPPWASTSSRRSSCSTSCAAMPKPGFAARFRQRHHPLHREARQGRAHRFTASCIRAAEEIEEYWRDVGTLDAYFEANLDLTDTVPKLNMYDRDWPIWTDQIIAAPAKFVHDEEGRRGMAISSLISQDCIVSAPARRSLLFTGVKMGSFSSSRSGDPALLQHRARCAAQPRDSRSGVRIPKGWSSARIRTRRTPLPPHRQRRLPDHQGHEERLA
jgi:glucose-1-phosphate adenylyltransferase